MCSPARRGFCPFPGLWWDAAVAKLRNKTAAFVAAYKAAGGARLGDLVQDSELGPMSCGGELHTFFLVALGSDTETDGQVCCCTLAIGGPSVPHACALGRWHVIETDPRCNPHECVLRLDLGCIAQMNSETFVRTGPDILRQLRERGFQPGDTSTAGYLGRALGNCTSLNPTAGSRRTSRNQQIWDGLAEERTAKYWSRAYFEPAREAYPAIKASDYGSALQPAGGNCGLPNGTCDAGCSIKSGSFSPCSTSPGAMVGNVGAPSVYGDGSNHHDSGLRECPRSPDRLVLRTALPMPVSGAELSERFVDMRPTGVTISGLNSVRGAVLATPGAEEGGSGNASVRPWIMSRSICLASNTPQCALRGCPLGPPSDTCALDQAGETSEGVAHACWWAERVMHMVVSGGDSVLVSISPASCELWAAGC